MNLFAIKMTSALVIFSMTLAAGIPLFAKRLTHFFNSSAIDAFTAGVFFAIGLHLIGEAASSFANKNFTLQFAFLIAGGLFLFLLFFEQLGKNHVKLNQSNNNIFTLLSITMLSIHSLLEGTVLGLTNNFTLTLMLAIIIIAHKWVASFSLAVQINKNIVLPPLRLLYFFIFTLMTPIGIILGNTLNQVLDQFSLIEPIFIALAAGTFLYLGTLHGLNHAVMIDKCYQLRNFKYLLIGFSFMIVVSAFT